MTLLTSQQPPNWQQFDSTRNRTTALQCTGVKLYRYTIGLILTRRITNFLFFSPTRKPLTKRHHRSNPTNLDQRRRDKERARIRTCEHSYRATQKNSYAIGKL